MPLRAARQWDRLSPPKTAPRGSSFLTRDGSPDMAVRKPCKSCPWRPDQIGDDIPGFSLQLAEGLVTTTGKELGAPIMACHQSRSNEEVACAGWLARYGWDNLFVRIGMTTGKYTPEMLEPGEGWPELHETYDEMMEKLRASDLRNKCELEFGDN